MNSEELAAGVEDLDRQVLKLIEAGIGRLKELTKSVSISDVVLKQSEGADKKRGRPVRQRVVEYCLARLRRRGLIDYRHLYQRWELTQQGKEQLDD
jgi:repressor of nif and glnA expression